VVDAFSLAGRVAVVTGANAGIGQAIAAALAGAGADVAVVGRSPATETAERIEAMGRRCLRVEAELGSTAACRDIVEQVASGLGGLDILVNNAGTIRRREALAVSEADWDAVMDVNLRTVFFLSQAAARHMIPRGGGKIINIASMLSFQGGMRVAAYTASKSGLAGITRALANEWGAQGINVNAIAPGYIATRNTEPLRRDEARNREILGRIPAGRWGVPEDLSGAAVFLASRAADYVHGAIIPVDGGWLAR
jgi:2-dehydro-3-deoxy-D-gluconate 5-dehydrogenase